jgi:hypothetical protein
MAIDSALKRKSAGGAGLLVVLTAGVTPDATEPVAWRWSAGWSYAGVAVASGGLVCATVSLSARVTATVSLSARVTATAGLKEC